jgi:mannan endo-1,4-beta-mannosidase
MLWVVAFASLLPLGASAQGPIRLEAEDAKLEGPNLHRVLPDGTNGNAASNVSGKGYVSGFQTPEDKAEFTVNLEKDGVYTIAVAYRSNGKKDLEVEVNGLTVAGSMPATPKGLFKRQTLARIELTGGKNTIVVHKGWGWYDLDYVEMTPAAPVAPVVAATDPAVDTQLTREAQLLLERLRANYGKTTLLGVYSQADAQYAVDQTGVRPAIMGGDLLAYSPQEVAHGSHPEKADEVGRLIRASNEGYVVTLSWHWCSPTKLMDTKEKPWWRSFYTDSTNFDVQKALADPASSDYLSMLIDIDVIAVQLRKLQDAHVPVLWRPLHEAEGGWFWWGARGPAPFVQLWRIVYDRLTKVDGIHNLVWVYTGDGNLDWYPGDAYVDVVGIDAYPKDLRDPQTQLWDDMQKKYGGRKLLTISEFGGVPDVPRMQRMGEFWSYAVSWSGKEGPRKNSVDELRRIYRSEGVTLPETNAKPAPTPITPSP